MESWLKHHWKFNKKNEAEPCLQEERCLNKKIVPKGTQKVGQKYGTSWWFQPSWKILVRMGKSSPSRAKIKHIWNHHPGYIHIYEVLALVSPFRGVKSYWAILIHETITYPTFGSWKIIDSKLLFFRGYAMLVPRRVVIWVEGSHLSRWTYGGRSLSKQWCFTCFSVVGVHVFFGPDLPADVDPNKL